MALVEDLFEGGVPRAAIGVGLMVAAPVVLPAVATGFRPVAKTLVRGYLAVAGGARRVASRTREQMNDLVAEVRHEQNGGDEAKTASLPPAKTETPVKKA
jgi:hypothetical protein